MAALAPAAVARASTACQNGALLRVRPTLISPPPWASTTVIPVCRRISSRADLTGISDSRRVTPLLGTFPDWANSRAAKAVLKTTARRDMGSLRQTGCANESPPKELPAGDSERPGNNLLSPSTDYHRPRMLNGRVRNGNGCDHPGMLTGIRVQKSTMYQRVAVEEAIEDLNGRRARGEDQCGEAIGC